MANIQKHADKIDFRSCMIHRPQPPSDMWMRDCNCIKEIKAAPPDRLDGIDFENIENTIIIYFYPKFITEAFGMRDENGRLGTS